jgi:nucleoside-diphosphate-sugar epimerase
MDSGISGPVNLGNPNEFTLLELAKKVGETLNIEPDIEFQNLPTDDPRMRCPDISYAKSALGWGWSTAATAPVQTCPKALFKFFSQEV